MFGRILGTIMHHGEQAGLCLRVIRLDIFKVLEVFDRGVRLNPNNTDIAEA